jgi:hypothetical protein
MFECTIRSSCGVQHKGVEVWRGFTHNKLIFHYREMSNSPSSSCSPLGGVLSLSDIDTSPPPSSPKIEEVYHHPGAVPISPTTGTAVAVKPGTATRVQMLNLLPLTNKRKKNHVPTNRIRVACIPCKINKQKCDALRPCTRCVMKGKCHLCVDRASDSILSPDEPISAPVVVTQNPDEVMAEVQLNKKTYRKRRKNSSSGSGGGGNVSPVDPKRCKILECEEIMHQSGADVFKNLFAYVLKPMYMSFAEKTSPFDLQDFISERTTIWRRYVTKMKMLFPRQEAEALREIMIQFAASASPDKEASRHMIEAFSQIEPYGFSPSSCVEKTENFTIPEETFSVIEDIFHVKCIEDTDLAVLHSIQRVIDGKVHLYLYYNKNVERLLGRTVESFGDQVDMKGEPTTPFMMRVMNNKSLETVSKFIMAWILREESFFTDTVEIVRPDGSFIRCYLAIIGGNEADFEKGESSLISVYKPCSVTFDPDGFSNEEGA